MKAGDLKNIIANLNDNYEILMEDFDDKAEAYSIDSVEICIDTKQIILKRWE